MLIIKGAGKNHENTRYKEARGMVRWLCGIVGNTQLPVAIAPGDLMNSFGHYRNLH